MHIIESLRERMIKSGIDAYLVPSFDYHQSEYVADYFKLRKWLTGFTGSAGFALITQDIALLWTDGRYHTQALAELSDGPFELMPQGLPSTPSLSQWLCEHLNEGMTVGFDGRCYSAQSASELENACAKKQLTFKSDSCLLEGLWQDRPAFPMAKSFELPLAYAGQNRTEKLDRLRAVLKDKQADGMVIAALDDIAWLLNIRGADIPFCPFVVAYLIVNREQVRLFVHEAKLEAGLKASLISDGIILEDYDHFYDALAKLQQCRLVYEPSTVNARMYQILEAHNHMVSASNVIGLMKAVKSEVELANIHNSQILDGVALLKFIQWLKEAVPMGQADELLVAKQLESFRRESPLCLGPSFNTIAGYKENAAMMHYSATAEAYSAIKAEGFLLVDSGGQYLNGTTDITRTFALGPLTDEERLDYTLTLKSHIGLARAVFLEGTCGPHLDILARQYMWEQGLDYKCGTGHGIGFVLSVHEGPHTIRCNQNDVALEVGMLLTNEPGVYKPFKHGVRIENTMLVKEREVTAFGRFLHFETISYCPIETSPLIKELLTEAEIQWLNDYHAKVREALSPHVSGELLTLLEALTEKF